MDKPIGLIGVGLVGRAIADRLLAAGYSVLGYDVDERQRHALGEAGGRAADSAAQVFEAATRVVLSLPTSEVVAEVIAAVATNLSAEHLVIDTTTGDPRQTRSTADKIRQSGAHYVDATILGSSVQVAEGTVVVLAGGDASAVEAAGEIIAHFARRCHRMGENGAGASMKLVANLVLGLNRAALAEGLALARVLDVDAARALEVLFDSAAYSRIMETKGEKMVARDFAPQARLAQHRKDVGLILAAAADAGLQLPISAAHGDVLDRAIAEGLGTEDNSAIIAAYDSPPSTPAESRPSGGPSPGTRRRDAP